ncbi:MAG: SDR family oxidoreductase [Candidatus Izimaplasma sp.]|nr:SDR family oxidoreductase [Candidatus Izimaplasma bacterium]
MLALITGASSGIGKELAIQLANKNYDLILIARRLDRLKEIKNSLSNVSVTIKQVDLTNNNQLNDLLKYLENKSIDLFINNAGYGIVNESITTPVENELNMIDLNIVSLHRLTKFALNSMKKGKIVNISSLAAFLPSPKIASYAATKSYVYYYSEAINYELKKSKKDLSVLTVAPGPVKTEFNDVAQANQKLKGMNVKTCVKIIIKGIDKNKSLIIPGFKMKIIYHLLKFIPKKLILNMSYRIQSKK